MALVSEACLERNIRDGLTRAELIPRLMRRCMSQ
jgi:hypothetical protein